MPGLRLVAHGPPGQRWANGSVVALRAPEDAARIIVGFAAGSLLELLGIALVDRQFHGLSRQRFSRELRWAGADCTTDASKLLPAQAALQFVQLPGLTLGCPDSLGEVQ